MDASQVGNAYEHALRELVAAQAENASMRIALEEIRARSEITAERMEKILAHAKRHEDEGFTDNDVSILLAENARLTNEAARLRQALEPIVRAYVKQSDPIGDSDLNGKQPRSVSMTLGDWRRAERAL